ncbi:hypothetical protein HBA54_01065 [Pelagibius litoralis]|uniref:Uncharacterized protein n=1 Tax=Pelagibius litoralis TaxID=374515 RepID=A0A967EUH0_9PROT|nr:hypothetical protein [Pelagibius litoralis]NIA67176.1 hypothetical protein [Pelagibius litoralis]
MNLRNSEFQATKLSVTLSGAAMVALLLGACSAPSSNAYGNRDALNSAPFWERNEQRD